MTKLIIQIPCYNEEEALPATLAELPRKLPGIDIVEWLIIDDGCEDRTVEVARNNGVDHIVRLPNHQGLAKGFVAGLEASVQAGADIIVNTDADNQYRSDDIETLIAPILNGEAEVVVGARPISQIAHFSASKKGLQRLGSWVVRVLSRSDVADAASGFRAMSRQAAMKTNVFSEYTYTLETIIQAGQKGVAIASVPIDVNQTLRPSRLVKSIPSYLRRQVLTIIRIFMTYRSFRFFALPGVVLFSIGLILGLRFLYYFLTGSGEGHVQSVILAALLLGTGVFLGVVGLLADLISVNRQLLEKIDWRLRQVEEQVRKTEKDP
jgi:glycosyltransferase involved in cell wall biosynthesis